MYRGARRLICALAIGSFAWGCSADTENPLAGKKPLKAVVDALVADLTANGGVAQVVGADGATVKDSETGAAIEIPAGALPAPEEGDAFVVSVVPHAGNALEAPDAFALSGDIFDIAIQSARNRTSVQPLEPVRITVPYASSVESADTARLAVGNFHNGAWVTQATEAVDAKAMLVSASFSTLSPFGALLGAAGNAAPVGDDQSVSVDEDQVLTGTVTGTDADGDTLAFTLAAGGDVAHGTLSLLSDGTFEYTPAADYHGSDQFMFVASDGVASAAVAIVSITVNSVNDAPVAYAKSVTGNEDAVISGSLSGTDADSDTLTFSLAPSGDVQHGTLTLQANGSFQYQPSANYNGSDTFSFKVSDGTVSSAAALVSITVNAVNDAPTLAGQGLTTLANTAVAATLAGADVEGSALTYAVVTAPTHGYLAVTASTGAFVYTPVTNYTGADVFYVKAGDGSAFSAAAAVTVSVKPFVRYVRPVAAGNGDGTSWANAGADLQTAVNQVSAAGIGQVWVAKGTYRSTGTATLLTMAANVDVYGGFTGTEAALADRGVVDPTATVLTGDTDSSGTLTAGDAYHVVAGASARLDGVTITGGNAVGAGSQAQGGGVYNSAQLTLANVRIYRNHANTDGGGIYSMQNLTLVNSRVEENTATSGGGIESYNSTLTLNNVAVVGNTASGDGGGLYSLFGTLSFSQGLVDSNTASGSGGGISVSTSAATVFNVQISRNTATTWRGGGLYDNGTSAITISHAQFVGNSAGTAGGGLALMSAPPFSLRNSSFWGNTAGSSKDILSPSANSVYNTCAETNYSAYGTANSTVTVNPFVTQAASGEYFFDPAQGCADWGSAATATTLFAATDTAWENWSSEISGTILEGSTTGVAAGLLHHPEDTWIRTFAVSATNVTWLTNAGASACALSNNANSTVIQLGASDLPSGNQNHALATGTVVTLVCPSTRSYAKAVTAAVP